MHTLQGPAIAAEVVKLLYSASKVTIANNRVEIKRGRSTPSARQEVFGMVD